MPIQASNKGRDLKTFLYFQEQILTLKTTQECSYFLKGNCSKGLKCPYIHLAPEEKKPVVAEESKPKVQQLFLPKKTVEPIAEEKKISPSKEEKKTSPREKEPSPERKAIKRTIEPEVVQTLKKTTISNLEFKNAMMEFDQKILELENLLNSVE